MFGFLKKILSSPVKPTLKITQTGRVDSVGLELSLGSKGKIKPMSADDKVSAMLDKTKGRNV